MALTPIPLSDYPAIRQAIDVALDDADLPDSTIGLSIFAGRAEDWARDTDPDLDTRTGREARSVARALVYYCAALLVPRVAMMTTEKMGNYSYTRAGADPLALVAELQALAEAEMAQATGAEPESAFVGSAFFTVAPGYRGR